MLLADLRTHLMRYTDLTGRIDARVYVSRAPQHASTPYLILSTVSGDPQYSLAGEIGTTQTIVQIAVWASDPNGPKVASDVAELVRDKLSGWRGDWGDRFVCDCLLTSEPVELAEEPEDGSQDWRHGVTQDYRVTHRRAVPSLN